MTKKKTAQELEIECVQISDELYRRKEYLAKLKRERGLDLLEKKAEERRKIRDDKRAKLEEEIEHLKDLNDELDGIVKAKNGVNPFKI